MEGFAPVRRMMSTDGQLSRYGELAAALDSLTSALMAHAAYYHDPVEVIHVADEMRAELAKPNPDRSRVRSLFDQVSSGIRRPTVDGRMVSFVEDAASRVRSGLSSL